MEYITLQLNSGEETYIDYADFTYLSNFKYSITKGTNGYVMMNIKIDGKWKSTTLHRFLINPLKGMVVDHVNRNKLDNRRNNLRVLTPSENKQNTKVRSDSKTGIKGIRYNTVRNQYFARLKHKGKYVFIEWFDDLETAKIELNKARKHYHKYGSET